MGSYCLVLGEREGHCLKELKELKELKDLKGLDDGQGNLKLLQVGLHFGGFASRLEGILYEVPFREVPIPHEFQPEQGQLGGQTTQRTVDIYHQGQGHLVRFILSHGEVQLEVQ